MDINEELFKRIKEVNRGSSVSNFILAAIENQIELEKGEQIDFIDIDKKRQITPVKEKRSEPLKKELQEERTPVEILNNSINYDKIKTVPLKNSIKNYYIWGQYNKFFTIKFALRCLALTQVKNDGNPVKLVEFQNNCAKEAAKIKEILQESDDKAERKWGEMFSAGLPDNEEKSRSRFIHHFIGYSDSQGNPVGALPELGFVVIENNQIALSPQGLAFTQLKNPILDENPLSPSLFSQEERQFLIEHLKINIPMEWQGMKTLIQWIENGLNTPESLNAKMATLDPKKWTDKMVNTYRTGILARMYDLGFISRKKIGLNAKYVVTEFGKKAVGIT